jgi:hypothetical protein
MSTTDVHYSDRIVPGALDAQVRPEEVGGWLPRLISRDVVGPCAVADWLALPATVDGSRVELINGYLYVTPPPSTGHQRASYRLARLLEDATRNQGRVERDVLPAVGVQISTACEPR